MTVIPDITAGRLREALDYNPDTGSFNWKISGKGIRRDKTPGASRRDRYSFIKIDQKSYLTHRLAWLYVYGEWPAEIDHINCDTHDNRISNLRNCSRPQNNGNRRQLLNKKYSSLKGVTLFKKTGRWAAGIKIDGKSVHLGCFDSDVLAHEAYKAAADRHFGEFARAA